MSANNQLVILKKNKKYEIHMDFCVDNEFEPTKSSLLKREKDLVSAIKFAKQYCAEEMVEYGYSINDNCLEN